MCIKTRVKHPHHWTANETLARASEFRADKKSQNKRRKARRRHEAALAGYRYMARRRDKFWPGPY